MGSQAFWRCSPSTAAGQPGRAPGAQAAAPARSLTPFVICYLDNGNSTVTVSVGVRSTNAATVNVAGRAPTTGSPGATRTAASPLVRPRHDNNVWASTLTYTDVFNGVDWSLTGNTVSVATFTECASKPVPARGNRLAFVAFGAVVTVAGALLLVSVAGSGRLRRNGA